MKMRNQVGITDVQLVAATGKCWEQWRAIVSAIPTNHPAQLRAVYGLNTWWSEMISARFCKPKVRVVNLSVAGSLRNLFVVCRDAGWGRDRVLPVRKLHRALEPSMAMSGQSVEKVKHWSDSLNHLRKHID